MDKVQIYNYRAWIRLTDPQQLAPLFKDLLTKAGYGMVNFSEHHFKPQGYTCIWLLSESHLALHTFPEESKTYVELSGCSETMNTIFMEEFNQLFTKAEILESSLQVG